MLRGGGLCVAGPGGSSIPRISPRIRALQDRLLDSLPPDATWETLTPSQRDALILHGLHPPNLNFGPGGYADDFSDVGEFVNHGGRMKVLRHQAGNLERYGRSRSYDDRLESETDDSGVRALGGASSSSSGGARSNSQEDDSSDPGVKRTGRFAKASSGDRTTRRENIACQKSPEATQNPKSAMKKVEVSNGRGNVNKIISKQYNKNAAVTSTSVSNITLDCRNVQGEKRRRSRVDIDGPFARERSVEKSLEVIQEREGGQRRTVTMSTEQLSVVRKSAGYEGYDDESQLHSVSNFEAENKLISPKGMKESGSSEEYDSGVNFKYDKLDETINMEEYIRERQEKGCEFYNDFDSDLSPRLEHMSSLEQQEQHLQQQQQQLFQQQQQLLQKQQKLLQQQNMKDRSSDRLLSVEDVRAPRKCLEHVSLDRSERSHNSRDRTKQRDTSGKAHEGRDGGSRSHEGRPSSSTALVDTDFMERLSKMPGEPLKSNLKVGYGARMNTNFDYRTNLNQDQGNKYSSNWNNIILNNDIPIKYSSHMNGQGTAVRESRYTKNANARSAGNSSNKTAAAMANQRRSEGSLLASADIKRSGEVRRTSNSSDPRRTPNPMHLEEDPRRVSSTDRTMTKKYGRSKSLDRKYLEDSTDEDSDFEMRRRTDRERRYQKGNFEWESGGRGGKGAEEQERHRRNGIMIIRNDISDSRGLKPKAKSAWDLSTAGPYPKNPGDEFDEFNVDTGFRTRSDIRDRWRSEDNEVVSRRKKSSDSSSDLARVQWQRRSCEFYLEGDVEDDPEGDLEFDRNRWYRRSCDIDLDYDRHNGRKQELDLEADWGRQALEELDDFESPAVVPGKKGRNAENGKREPQTRNKVRYDPSVNTAGRNGKTKSRGGGEDDVGRRTARGDDHPRSRTSLGHYGGKNEKRERSRTPHVLRGKLRLLKSILSF